MSTFPALNGAQLIKALRRLAWSTVNVYVSTYRCFYEKVLRWTILLERL